ncbi:MAG: TIGR02452 family protein, partial [Porphyromonadaceae bacterium]|nr:TIGR02452 family protein [Porphyromonadaceae bacterium]
MHYNNMANQPVKTSEHSNIEGLPAFQTSLSKSIDNEQKRSLRKAVFENTVEIVCNGKYRTPSGRTIIIPNIDIMCSGSKMYDREFSVVKNTDLCTPGLINVVETDCLDEAEKLRRIGLNPAVLNMANRKIPCAGIVQGTTQEDDLFRRTTLFHSLYQFYKNYRDLSSFLSTVDYQIENRKEQYPMNVIHGGIYTPHATLFRKNEACGYELMEEPVSISFISVAGIYKPETIPGNSQKLTKEMVSLTMEKIKTILRIGLNNGHDSL